MEIYIYRPAIFAMSTADDFPLSSSSLYFGLKANLCLFSLYTTISTLIHALLVT